MKKSICILLIFAMLLGLCACGKKTASAETPAASAAAPAAEQPAEAAPAAAEPAQAETPAAPAAPAALSAAEAFDAPSCGFRYVYPEEYKNASGGVIRMMEQGTSGGSATFELVYILVPEGEHQAFLDFEKTLDDGLTLAALFERGYMAFTLFLVYADRADGSMAKKIENDMIANAAAEDMIYVGQTKASAAWYCSLLRPKLMETDPDSFRQTMGDAFDEYISFARNKDLVLSGFTEI